MGSLLLHVPETKKMDTAMKIIDSMQPGKRHLSLEFFPPKDPAEWPGFLKVAERLAVTNPLFVSVTYGAGGGSQDSTLEISGKLKNEIGLEPMAHLTCVGADATSIEEFLGGLQEREVHNVLALRGDPPKGMTQFVPENEEFRHASDLAAFITQKAPNMGVAVAGYPEAHPQSQSIAEDLEWTRHKMEYADLCVTQLFFDNRAYFDFKARLAGMGVNKPLIPGVLPILSLGSIRRILSLCGANIPGNFYLELEEANEKGGAKAVRELGVQSAIKQCRNLLEGGAPGVHLYTLNQAEACLEIADALQDLL